MKFIKKAVTIKSNKNEKRCNYNQFIWKRKMKQKNHYSIAFKAILTFKANFF